MAFFQHADNGCDRSTRFDGGGTCDAQDQRFAEFHRVARIGVGFDERFLFHGRVIADGEANPVAPIGPGAHANRWMGAPPGT